MPNLWALAARGPAAARRRRGASSRARRGPGTPAFAPQGFGYHRDSNGVIASGAARFPLRLVGDAHTGQHLQGCLSCQGRVA